MFVRLIAKWMENAKIVMIETNLLIRVKKFTFLYTEPDVKVVNTPF